MADSFFSWFVHETKKALPRPLYNLIAPPYHLLLSFLGAVWYGFPSKKIFVIGITGTKGKTSTIEIVNAILERAGKKTAIASTIRFKVGDRTSKNMFKMTMPGRFALQRLIARAVRVNCDYVIIEMTSEGAKQHRHRFITMDALIVTNISPEHIEAHGSYEKYVQAKVSIGKALSASSKRPRYLAIDKDNPECEKFTSLPHDTTLLFSPHDAEIHSQTERGSEFTWKGFRMKTTLPGTFNVANIIAAGTLTTAFGIRTETVKEAIEQLTLIRGRMEKVHEGEFDVIVDYAHTEDSMKKVYDTLKGRNLVCVFGATGGGRDKWKRPLMGKVAAYHCSQIFLTNDDPYDEDPETITDEVKKGIDIINKDKARNGENVVPCEVIIDRRKAIEKAIQGAKKDSVVVITGKGTDPFLMEAGDTKTPWDDAEIVRETIAKLTP